MNGPFDQREDRPIAADSNVLAGSPLGAALPANDRPGLRELTAEQLDAQPLRVRVAAVSAGTLTFFMSHETTSLSMS